MTIVKKQFTFNSEEGEEFVEKKHIDLDNTRLPSIIAVKNEVSIFVPLPIETEVKKVKHPHSESPVELSVEEDSTEVEEAPVHLEPTAEELCLRKCKELLDAAKAQANEIVSNANQEAEQLKAKTINESQSQLNQTQAECKKLFEEAEAQIKATIDAKQAQIESDTRAELSTRFEPIFQTLIESAALIGPTITKWINAQEEQLVKLAVSLARKIIRQELISDSEKYLHLINQALPIMYGEPEVKLFVNPTTLRSITTDPILLNSFERLKLEYPEMIILEDSTISDGFRLQGPVLKYDYDLTRILDEAEAALVRQSMASRASLDADNS